MPDRYVVPAGGNWNDPNTWSAVDGGAGGAGVPTAADNAYASNLSGNLVQNTAAAVCLALDFMRGSGYNGTFSGNLAINVAGSLRLSPGMTRSFTGAITYSATSPVVIQSSGKTFANTFTFNGVGGKWTLQDALTNTSSGTISHQAGEIDLNGFTFTSSGRYQQAVAGVVLTMNGSLFEVVGTSTSPFTLLAAATVNGPGTLKASVSGAGTISLNFGGGSLANVNAWVNTTGGGPISIISTPGFTLNQFKVNPGLTVNFTAGRTYTATDWQWGLGCTIGSVSAAQHTLVKTGGGPVLADGATVSRSTATPAATFYAGSGVDGGNNNGWTFGYPAAPRIAATPIVGTTKVPAALVGVVSAPAALVGATYQPAPMTGVA